MVWLYVRSTQNEDGSSTLYAGRTHHTNYHDRADSRKAGKFAVGMDGKELAVQVSEDEAHLAETEAIQFLVAFVGREHVHNRQQVSQPFTGWRWTN